MEWGPKMVLDSVGCNEGTIGGVESGNGFQQGASGGCCDRGGSRQTGFLLGFNVAFT